VVSKLLQLLYILHVSGAASSYGKLRKLKNEDCLDPISISSTGTIKVMERWNDIGIYSGQSFSSSPPAVQTITAGNI
jgi:hypothetical protein